MACFLVSAAEAVAVTVYEKKVEKKEELAVKTGEETSEEAEVIPFSRKLKWLTGMLWGGVVLLLFEHVWHGEVVPYFPFLTAMSSPEDTVEMLKEMATVGVGMAVLITLVWLGVCKAADSIMKRKESKAEA